MTRPLHAEIVAIGTELLLGELTDTNSVFLARTLRDMGINLYFKTTVGDNAQRIESALRIALDRADIVITCGGLGPTVDDMTRQAVAAATDRGLTFHQHLLDAIALRFAGFRVPMTENNRRQAYVPDGAVIIENPVGTAPSFAVETEDKVIISLPGVPRELKFLMTEKVVPYLRGRYGLKEEIIKARILKAAGIGESALDDLIGSEMLNSANPSIGLAAHSGQIDVRVTAKADSGAAADALIQPMVEALLARIGRFVYGYDDAKLEDALADTLHNLGIALYLVEAGVTTDAHERLKRVVSGSTREATPDAVLRASGLEPGLPLRTAAEQLAAAFRDKERAVLVILSTPGDEMISGDSAERTAVAVSYDDKTYSRGYGFGADNDMARIWTVTWTMATLWRMLRDQFDTAVE